jgi:hypothetical protein
MTGFENELWVTAGASTFSAVVILIGGLFVLFQNPRRDLNWLFFIFTLSTLAYIAANRARPRLFLVVHEYLRCLDSWGSGAFYFTSHQPAA